MTVAFDLFRWWGREKSWSPQDSRFLGQVQWPQIVKWKVERKCLKIQRNNLKTKTNHKKVWVREQKEWEYKINAQWVGVKK